jgi:uncharacterized membrane protein HdeD (DUF308 family)
MFMTAETVPPEDAAQARKWWWLFLISGIIWLLISLVILRFDITSVTAVGILAGVVVLIAGANELVAVWVAPSWRWLHGILAVLFLITGIACLVYPGRTFVTIAWLFGWFLLFKGIFDIIASIALRQVNSLWWLGLIAGIVEIGLAFWASGYYGGSAVLLVAWVGIGAMMRGVTEIITAFTLRQISGEEGATTAA